MGGGGLVGGIGGLVGIKSKEEKQAQRMSEQATATAKATQARIEELGGEMQEFHQGVLDDWESMFGPIEKNLNDYYSNLDPVKFATTSKTSLAEHIDKQIAQVNETLSAQGIQTSGMRSQSMKEAAFAKAVGSAEIDVNAPEQVHQMQQQWLSQQEPEKATAIRGISDSYATRMGREQAAGGVVAGTYRNQSAMYAGIAEQNRGAALDLFQSGADVLMGKAASGGATPKTGGEG